MIIMIKHKVVAVFVLAAIMFVLTNQDELFEDLIGENKQCPQFDSSGFTGWDVKHRWCPPFLARAMKQICRGKYNEPPEAHQQTRKKRQIMEECCWNCCTARYLKHYYCNDSRVDNRKLYIPPISNEGTEIYEIYDDK